MRSRGLVVAIAVVLAALAAVGVIVYTNSVKNGGGQETTAVIVSTQDIPPNTALNPLLDSGVFQTVNVPNDTLVQGAVTDESELRDQTTASQIFKNEQIPTSRLATGTGNTLGISEGHVGLGIQVDGPNGVNGYVQNNDNVVVYATFPAGTVVTRKSLKQLLTPAQIQKFTEALQQGNAATLANSGVFTIQSGFTVTLIKSVKVLSVSNPPVDSSTGKPASGSSNLVLDMLPEDAQAIVNANNDAVQLWLGLLPPVVKDGTATPNPGYNEPASVGLPFAKVVGVGGA
jgi:Flp pilus assembly protein CpaB